MANRSSHKKQINKTLQIKTSGTHTDEYWKPVYAAFEALRSQGYGIEISYAEYKIDDMGIPIEKCWKYQISHKELTKSFYGVLTAHGAGTVKDPLNKYDITAYVC